MSTPPPPPPNQPPPPPGNPPAGGFGAPQDPRAAGFGAPQDPRAGGFGAPPPMPPQQPAQPPAPPAAPPAQPPAAPAAPAQPPAGQPGYGYPQQDYGHPQAPQPAQGYGFPQQPGHQPQAPHQAPDPYRTQPMGAGSPAAPHGSGGSTKRNQLLIIAAAVVAIAVIVAGGFWLVGDDGGGDDTPTATGSPSPGGGENKGGGTQGGGGAEKPQGNTNAKTLVNVEQPVVPPDSDGGFNTIGTYGSWLTDTVYAKSDVAKVIGYNLDNGSQKWTVPLPGHICGASQHVSGNKTAVLFQYKLPTAEEKSPACSSVGVIDLSTGKLVWSAEAKSATNGDRKVTFEEITISGKTVAAGGLSGGGAWNLDDGKVLWDPKTDNEGCYDMGYAGGEALAVLRKCGRIGSQTVTAQVLDPTTGAPKYSYRMSQGIDYGHIISTKPLVVTANVNRSAPNAIGISDIFLIDESGKLKATIPLTSGNYDPSCNNSDVENCSKIAVGNGKIYLPSVQHQGSGSQASSRTNEILSFDLNTGKQTTDRADAGDRYTMYPLRMDGSNIIAYKRPPYDKGGQIVSIDGATMKQTTLMVMPDDKESRSAETAFVEKAEYRYADGRLFIADDIISSSRSVVGDKDYLFVSFTTH
ncbi:PQQ-binding-like beta-propeller repeat protein [Streptomyces sp. NPDC089799]|uniref:outer membrane protein assembly factor BamB family protein n=1 Tax=Streptomyces sp. NPDC089799 TaxID=3155066 RepID=UPI0034336959